MENQENAPYDLLLKGGTVIDPANSVSGRADVAVREGRIAAVAADIPQAAAARFLDVSGCYVVPGLIDMHCHLVQKLPVTKDMLRCIDADAHMLQNGVTTAVDAGTCGWRDFLAFKEQVIDQAKVRILAFINIATGGMLSLSSELEPVNFHPGIVAEVANAFPGIVVGVKTAHYRTAPPFTAEYPAWASVDGAIRAAERCGKPAMFDVRPVVPERTYPDLLLKKMRPGDIHTHVFAGHIPVLAGNGEVEPYMQRARERGVRFDLGHGAGSFTFRNAVPACRQGFLPETLSTDLYADNVAGPAIGLVHVMSKMLNLGLSLEDVVARTTSAPAAVLGHPELGSLTPQGCADIAVLRLHTGSVSFADSEKKRLDGDRWLECLATIRAGTVLYNPQGIGLSAWEESSQ